MDDASTKNDVEIIQSYQDHRIVLLRNEQNRKTAFSANRGLAEARGEFIARMDSDDICMPDRIEKQVIFLQEHQTIDILSSQAEFFGNKTGIYATNINDPAEMKVSFFFGFSAINPTIMFRTSFLRKNDLRYSEYQIAEDYEMMSRCVFLGNMCEYPEVLLRYRKHPQQISVASHVKQDKDADLVRLALLKRLGITANQDELTVHHYFCTENINPNISLSMFEDWADKLLLSNERNHLFDGSVFKKSVFEHFFVLSVKMLRKKTTSVNQLLHSKLFRHTLYPAHFRVYLKRLVFSKRLNTN